MANRDELSSPLWVWKISIQQHVCSRFMVVLSSLAIGCFFVAVLFGFIFHAPFPHRWYVLGASVVFLLLYVLYRFVMQGVQRLLR